jgi:hypothetical protein
MDRLDGARDEVPSPLTEVAPFLAVGFFGAARWPFVTAMVRLTCAQRI